MAAISPAAADAGVSRSQAIASVSAGTIGLIVLGLQPLLYTAYVVEGTISEQRLGLLSAAELMAVALGSALGVALLRRFPVWMVALGGAVMLCGGNALVADKGDAVALFLIRILAGAGAGLLVGVAASAIARTHRIGAWAGAFLFGQALTQYGVMRWFAAFAPGAEGSQIQQALALAGGLTVLLIPLLPRRFAPMAEHADGAQLPPSGRGLIGLAAAFLCIGGTGAIWGYAELWMHSEGVPQATAAHLLSMALLGQIIGSIGGAFIADGRWSWLRLLTVLLALVGTIATWLSTPASAALAFSFGVLFMLGAPSFTGVLAMLDPSKRAHAYGATAQLAGLSVIPTLVGEALAGRSLSGVILACLAIILGGAGLMATQIPYFVRFRSRSPSQL